MSGLFRTPYTADSVSYAPPVLTVPPVSAFLDWSKALTSRAPRVD
jgi:hypothetical protein